MKTYTVSWTIEVDADNADEAAVRAQIIMYDTDPANTAKVFAVCEHMKPETTVTIDLSE